MKHMQIVFASHTFISMFAKQGESIAAWSTRLRKNFFDFKRIMVSIQVWWLHAINTEPDLDADSIFNLNF